jgi:hypothetical protein
MRYGFGFRDEQMTKRYSRILAAIVLIANCRSIASLESDVALLHELARKNQINQERIVTWRGKANVHDLREGFELDENKAIQTRSDVKFYYDASQNAVRWNWEVTYRFVKNGTEREDITDSLETTFNAMKKEGILFRLSKIYPPDDSPKPGLKVYPSRRNEGSPLGGPLSNAFDPTLALNVVGINIVENLGLIARKAKDDRSLAWVITNNQNHIILELNKKTGVDRFEFDLNQGGLCTRHYTKDVTLETECKISWEQTESIWTPYEYTYRNHNRNKTTVRKIIFIDSVLNTAIDPSEFTIEKLGIRPGDMIQDTRTGEVYPYRAGSTEATEVLNAKHDVPCQ